MAAAEKEDEKPPKDITLKDVPADVWDKIRLLKIKIMTGNKNRVNVSHQEAIYKLIRQS